MDPESMGQKTLIITQILISLILVKYSDKRTKNVTKKNGIMVYGSLSRERLSH